MQASPHDADNHHGVAVAHAWCWMQLLALASKGT